MQTLQPVATKSATGGDKVNVDLTGSTVTECCEIGQEKNGAMGNRHRKIFKATPSRAREKPLLEHRIKIGAFIGLSLLRLHGN